MSRVVDHSDIQLHFLLLLLIVVEIEAVLTMEWPKTEAFEMSCVGKIQMSFLKI